MAASTVTIRPATPADSEALARLTRELGYDSSSETAAARLQRLQASGRDAVFVAESSGTVAGWIHVALLDSLEMDASAEIRGLVVAEGSRGAGIGAQLVGAAEAWAARHEAGRVRVRSNIIRERARRFYERLGYSVTKAQNVFDKTIGEPGEH